MLGTVQCGWKSGECARGHLAVDRLPPHGMLEHVNPGDLRAGDADRERVAERLRTALDEGRLNLYEYDDRLREAYAAKTYGELDALLADLPGVTPVPACPRRLPD